MKKTLLAALVAAVGLSACSSLDGKSPSEMVKISTERSLTKDYSYNFDGEVRAFLSDKDKGVAPKVQEEVVALEAKKSDKESADKELSEEAQKAAEKAEKALKEAQKVLKDYEQSSAEDGSSDEAESNEYAEEAMTTTDFGKEIADGAQKYPAATAYLNESRLIFKGAVDLRVKKIEIVPELQIKARNEFSSVKMPILLDGNDMSVSVDTPASIPMVLNFLIKDPAMRARMVNQSFRFNWADVENKEIPLKSTLKAVVKSAYTAYNSVPADQFRLDEMDEFGKRVGARYRVSIIWTGENLDTYYQAFFNGFNEELTRLEIAGRDEGSTREGYDKVRSAFEDMKGSASFAAVQTNQWMGTPMVESLYLDRKGRMVGKRSYVQMNGTEKAFNIDMSLAMSRFGNPVFTYQPKASESVSLKELIEAFKAQNSESDEASEQASEDYDYAAEAAAATAEPARKVVKKKAVKKKAAKKRSRSQHRR